MHALNQHIFTDFHISKCSQFTWKVIGKGTISCFYVVLIKHVMAGNISLLEHNAYH